MDVTPAATTATVPSKPAKVAASKVKRQMPNYTFTINRLFPLSTHRLLRITCSSWMRLIYFCFHSNSHSQFAKEKMRKRLSVTSFTKSAKYVSVSVIEISIVFLIVSVMVSL